VRFNTTTIRRLDAVFVYTSQPIE